MKRQIVTIDESKCDGCGLCVPTCHEGALQIIDGKARLISDLFCDGLGACLGHCPQGAITLEEREAEAYDEIKVMKSMIPKGNNTIKAHLHHLLDHGETAYLKQAFRVLQDANVKVLVPGETKYHHLRHLLQTEGLLEHGHQEQEEDSPIMCGCAGSTPVDLRPDHQEMPLQSKHEATQHSAPSALQNWPIQMHLINPAAAYFKGADLLIAADCTAFSMGAFHHDMMRNKSLVIACPKLDSSRERYIDKFISLIDEAEVNTITVAMMEVPCCGGLIQLVNQALSQSRRKVPVKQVIIGIKGELLREEWI